MIASTIARWGIAAVIALSLGIIALKQLYPSLGTAPRPAVIVVGLDPSQSRRAEFPVRERPHDSDAAFIQLAALAEKFWEQPQLLPLKPAVSTNANRAYAVFDPASRQGFIGIEQLPRLADGSRYHLWLVDSASGKIHDAGVLPLSQATHGLYFFSAGPNSGAKPARIDFFVTVEDADVSAGASPSGKVVLGQTRI